MRRGEEERTLASAGWPGGLPSKLQVPPGGPAGEEERRVDLVVRLLNSESKIEPKIAPIFLFLSYKSDA